MPVSSLKIYKKSLYSFAYIVDIRQEIKHRKIHTLYLITCNVLYEIAKTYIDVSRYNQEREKYKRKRVSRNKKSRKEWGAKLTLVAKRWGGAEKYSRPPMDIVDTNRLADVLMSGEIYVSIYLCRNISPIMSSASKKAFWNSNSGSTLEIIRIPQLGKPPYCKP